MTKVQQYGFTQLVMRNIEISRTLQNLKQSINGAEI